MELDDDTAELSRRLKVDRVDINRIRFTLPPEKMSTMDFSLITTLCLSGNGDGKMGTHLPDDTDIEVEIRINPEQRG